MTRGKGGVKNGLKIDDVIYGWPIIVYLIARLVRLLDLYSARYANSI